MTRSRRTRFLALAAAALGGCSGLELGSGAPSPTPHAPAESRPPIQANLGELPDPQATLAAICADDGLALSRFDLNTLRHRFAEVCCGIDGLDPTSARCTAPWPAADPIPCGRWGELQASLLARYGSTFQDQPTLRAHFEQQPWYRPNEAFQTNAMAITAKRNVATLTRFRAERIDCE